MQSGRTKEAKDIAGSRDSCWEKELSLALADEVYLRLRLGPHKSKAKTLLISRKLLAIRKNQIKKNENASRLL